jgi:hypothetical protein
MLYVEDQRVTQSRRSWIARRSGQVPSWMPSIIVLRSSVRREPDFRQMATIDLVLETGLVRRASAYSIISEEGITADWITGS